MPEIRVDSEKELIDIILHGKAYKEFRSEQLRLKIDRERRAWDLIEQNRGNYNRESLSLIFDTVDMWGGKRR
ncbi:MAG: hypothetical protein M1570_02800 [Chloroflexi bacterium]|nr:hypothetical protein [Chloroflexota bacterium]